MLDSFCLTQVVTEPTHTSSNGNQTLIDLALLSDVSQLIECNNVLPLSNSDHSSIELKLKAWNSRPPPINQKRRVWNHEDADFDKTCELIDSVDWDSILCDKFLLVSVATNLFLLWRNVYLIPLCTPLDLLLPV